jgi:hypothetical protein
MTLVSSKAAPTATPIGQPASSFAKQNPALHEAETQALIARRQEVLGEAAAQQAQELNLPRVGLALSGGGVRSATFGLGLLRGLARSRDPNHPGHQNPAQCTLASEGLLGRVDYLSSVSGGGYIAGMWGRLVSLLGFHAAQQRLVQSDSNVLQWLRRNGRYLTPTGSRDIGMAAVTFLRSLLAIHFEFMFFCMALGLVVVAPHLWQHTFQLLQPQGWEPWQTPWWALATTLWLFIAPGLIAAYWAARDGPDAPHPVGTLAAPSRARTTLRDGLFLVVLATVTFVVLRALYERGALDWVSQHALTRPAAVTLVLLSLFVGQVAGHGWLATRTQAWSLEVALLRNRLTRALRVVTLVALALVGLGVLDRVSWWLMEELRDDRSPWLWGGVGLGGVVVLVLRTLMQPLQQLAAEAGNRSSQWMPRLLNLAGFVGLLALVLAWLVALQWFVFSKSTFELFAGVPTWMRAALLLGVWALWVLLTACNSQMANASSLHSFYRARLTRAYLAVGNARRGLEEGFGQPARAHASVTEVVEGDDTRLSSYHPETRGGPIHLVNVCLNQTRDGQSGLYSADRKGCNVTATWRGLEVGRDGFVAARADHDVGTLGRWVAVSGAAASPGAGSYTSRGLALLVYFLGVRLGLWLRAPTVAPGLKWLSRLGWRFMPKPLMLSSEASATFFGVDRPWWYLSDGGHFENTGVYALLKRELDFIILSDAGCDVRYEFSDLENLVRKARIDFGAEIDFYTADEAAKLFGPEVAELKVLSPEHLNNNHSCRGVLLARIRYRERPGPLCADGRPGPTVRPEATLLVVKPNLHDELNVDVLAYAQKHPDFPHESTGDQSFDEAQWESYHRLGEDFGRAMSDAWLAHLPGWKTPARHALQVAARLCHASVAVGAAKATAGPLWKRSARATAIGTTLGLGASGTLLLSLWQVQDQLQKRQAEENAEVRQVLTETSESLQRLDGSCPKLPGHMVAQTSYLLDLRGSPTLRRLEKEGVKLTTAHLERECLKPAAVDVECKAAQKRFTDDLCTKLVEKARLDYWYPDFTREDQEANASNTVLRLQTEVDRLLGRQDPRGQTTASAPPDTGAGPWSSAHPADHANTAASPSPMSDASASVGVDIAADAARGAAPAGGSSAPSAVRSTSLLVKAVNDACKRSVGAERSVLYVQVYDETSLRLANQWRQTLLGSLGADLQVAPIENVSRTAELRQQRRPSLWPKPTFLLHDSSGGDCAQALKALLKTQLKPAASDDAVWIRNLPKSQPNLKKGVIELWLPPGSLSDPKAVN